MSTHAYHELLLRVTGGYMEVIDRPSGAVVLAFPLRLVSRINNETLGALARTWAETFSGMTT